MSQYLIVIAGPEAAANCEAPNPEAQRAMMQEWFDYTEDLKKAGVLRGGEALMPSATGSRISEKDGKRTVLDGPFAEAKEVVGGYYQIETKTRAEALEWAAKCPGVRGGGFVELREVVVFTK